MQLKKLFSILLVSLFMTATAYAADSIKIGIYFPLSGENAFGGQLELEGVQLANKAYPRVLNRQIELIVMDNKSDRNEAAKAVTQLTSKDQVTGLIGTYGSTLAMAGAEIAEKAKTPGIGTSCTSPQVTRGKKYYFRACFIDPYQGAGAATYVYKNLGFKKAAILKDVSNDYALGLTTFFTRSFRKMGGEIVANIDYNSGDQDFTEQLNEIIALEPEVLFLPAYFREGALILKQARELGANFKIMGGDAMDNPDTVKIAGSAVDGFLHTTFPYDVNMKNMSPKAEEFTNAWRENYPDKEPNVNAALGYTSYMMFVEAILKAGNADDREAITEALGQIKNFATPMGIMTINANHDAELPVGVIEIKNGKRVYLGEVEPAL